MGGYHELASETEAITIHELETGLKRQVAAWQGLQIALSTPRLKCDSDTTVCSRHCVPVAGWQHWAQPGRGWPNTTARATWITLRELEGIKQMYIYIVHRSSLFIYSGGNAICLGGYVFISNKT